MSLQDILPLALGLVIFSFLVTGLLLVPYINLLYKLRLIRRKEAPKRGKVPLFDRLHDIKAGTPVGGGILIIVLVSLYFALLFPFASRMGVYIRSSYNFRNEIFIIFFSFISFGLLGLSDDLIKIFGKPRKGNIGLWFGLERRQKFVLQWILALIIGYILYKKLGISFIHIPGLNVNLNLGVFYVPVSSFIIVTFSNAFNITDGLDGLASGLLLICLIAFAVIAWSNLDTPLTLFITLWLGSLMAFLYFNIWPARIILGDSGALSFGAMLSVIGLLSGGIVALFVIGALFLIEVTSSFIQIIGWRFLHRPIFPLAPIHHTFLARGWEEPKIVMRAWIIGVIFAIFGLWLSVM